MSVRSDYDHRAREREGKKKEWKASPRLYPLVFFASIKTGSTDADGRRERKKLPSSHWNSVLKLRR